MRVLLLCAKHLFLAAMVAVAAAGGSSIPMAQGGLSRLAIARLKSRKGAPAPYLACWSGTGAVSKRPRGGPETAPWAFLSGPSYRRRPGWALRCGREVVRGPKVKFYFIFEETYVGHNGRRIAKIFADGFCNNDAEYFLGLYRWSAVPIPCT